MARYQGFASASSEVPLSSSDDLTKALAEARGRISSLQDQLAPPPECEDQRYFIRYGGTYDFTKRDYPLITKPMEAGDGPVFELLDFISSSEQELEGGGVDVAATAAELKVKLDESLAFISSYEESVTRLSAFVAEIENGEVDEYPLTSPSASSSQSSSSGSGKREAIDYYFSRETGKPVEKPELLIEGIKAQVESIQEECKSPEALRASLEGDEEALNRLEQDTEELQEKFNMVACELDSADGGYLGAVNDTLSLMQDLIKDDWDSAAIMMMADQATVQMFYFVNEFAEYKKMVSRITDSSPSV